jgi:hypothetical protein
MSLSVVVQVCDRNSMLQQTLPTWINYSCDEIVIFDQPKKELAYDVVSQYLSDPRIKLIESLENIPYSLTKGRNVTIRNSTTDDILSLDADTKILPGMPKLTLEDGFFYHGIHGVTTGGFLQGCIMFKRSDFDKINGYNERLIGWGYDDDDFRFRLGNKLRSRPFPPYLFHINHDDNLRTQSYTEKNKSNSWNSNCVSANEQPWTEKDKQMPFKVIIYRNKTKAEIIV